MRKNIAAGNWKMNLSLQEAETLVNSIIESLSTSPGSSEVIFGAPFPYLYRIAQLCKDHPQIHVAAQDVSAQEKGAYTGETAAAMLTSIGLSHCIVGHSERRQYHGEGGQLLATKIDRLLAHGLVPIYCIGERLEQRESDQTLSVIKEQVSSETFHLDETAFSKLIVAYEPVWAIGTGKTASPEQAQEVHQYIRGLISSQYSAETAAGTSILYGGSVKPANAKELFAQADIDGGLVGGASLKAADFVEIIRSF